MLQLDANNYSEVFDGPKLEQLPNRCDKLMSPTICNLGR